MNIIKSDFTRNPLIKRIGIIISSFFIIISLNAQCDMFCEGTIQVGFDSGSDMCVDTVQAETVLKNFDSACLSGDFAVHILNESGNQVLDYDGEVDYEWVGRKLQYKVIDNVTKGSCWGYLDVEDKKKPQLLCDNQDPIDVYCFGSIQDTLDKYFKATDCDINVKTLQKTSFRAINRCNAGLPDDVLEEYLVTLIGEDSWGNKSEECPITFRILRIQSLKTDIEYPDSYSKEDDTAISCSFNLAEDDKGLGFPSPIAKNGFDGTGVPSIDEILLYPNNGQFCNLWVDYMDEKVKEGCETRLIRNWIITETSCGGGRRVEIPQIIDIIDDKGPEIEKLEDMVLTTSNSICGRTLRLDPPMVSDTCDNGFNLNLKVEGGKPAFIPDFEKGDEVELDTGLNVLIFIAKDECNNTTRDTLLISVQDLTPPTTVCKTYTVTSLVEEGFSMVHASSFDNGSKDECYLSKILVKRMDDGAPCGNEEDDTLFDEYVGFCCEDIGQRVMVIVRTYDRSHNMSECMVEVEVQDKMKPLIACPPDLTLSCGIDLEDLSVFGLVRKTPEEVESIEIDSDFFENSSGPLVDGLAFDNCDFTIDHSAVYILDNCGSGTILRKFIVEGKDGSKDSCIQTLTILKNPDFFEEMIVTWPSDTTLYDCFTTDDEELGEKYLGSPQFEYLGCQMVGLTSSDEVYNFSGNGDGSCFKILRKWTMIDWCAQDPRSNDYLRKTETQVIKIIDTIPPEIIGDYLPIDTCSYDALCDVGIIRLQAEAEDDECGNDLIGYFEIDRDSDGDYDYKSEDFIGSKIEKNLEYAIGSHKVRYTFYDRCGNASSVEQDFVIVNCKEPTPYALNGLVIALMGMDTTGNGKFDLGMAEIWATDFDAGSKHPCDIPVILSFSSDTTDKSRTFFCDSVGMRSLEFWSTIIAQNGELIQAYTTTTIDIQDNQEICDPEFITVTLDIFGDISSHTDVPISNTLVRLEGGNMEYATDEAGSYAFPPMPTGGFYDVVPYKNDDVLNGVNTLDLVKIQRHILGIKTFDQAYQFIAGDVNKDDALSATDIIELRKLILGLNDNFKTNTSWRFIDRSYSIPVEASVLEDGFPEIYSIDNLQSDIDIDFMGIKIGDVDGDHKNNNLRQISTRNNDQIDLTYLDSSFEKNDEVSIQFSPLIQNSVLGLQLSLEFKGDIQLLSLSSEYFDINESDYNYNGETKTLTLSKALEQAVSMAPNKKIITVDFMALESGSTGDYITLSDEVLSSELYDNNEIIHNVNLLSISESLEAGYELHQNNPNPFYNYTEIGFDLPRDQLVELTIYDVTGRLVYRKYDSYVKGRNSLILNSEELNAKGMLYYQIKADDFIAAKKMVLIN